MTARRHDPEQRRGLLQASVDVFLDRTRAVAEMMAAAGSGALSLAPEPVPSTVNRMLESMRQVAEQVPPVTAELDVLVEEVHAKRLSIQALQAELRALDHQLEVLEGALAPMQAWTRQWERMRRALTHLDVPAG
jgi:hypothetical protein